MASPSRATRLLPRLALSTLLCAALVGTVAAPGFANRSQVPDGGERPQAVGEVPMPDGSLARPPAPDQLLDGPLAAEIAEVELEIETLALRLQTVLPEVGPAQSAVEYAEEQWQLRVAELAEAQDTLDGLVDESFRGAAALPPDLYLPKLPGLNAHAPLPVEAPLGVRAAARGLVEAREAAQAAEELLEAAREAEENLTDLRTEYQSELSLLEDQLEELRDRNLAELAERERAREAAEQDRAPDRFPESAPVDGFEAHPDALRAVRFALNQLGKPYQWGAQGPDRFDCSGLVWAAYRHVGVTVPRVAADQYNGTRDGLITRSAAVAQRGLLPGDLVFFSSGGSWQSIHHVGIYVGGGQMVHAPNRNEVVKVSPVWWSRFFGATRVIEAVPSDDDSPPRPRPTPGPPGVPSPTPGPPTGGPTSPPGTTPPGTTPPGTTPPGTTPPGSTPPGSTPPGTTPPGTTPPGTTPPGTTPPDSPTPSPSPTPTSPTPTPSESPDTTPSPTATS